MMRPHALPAGEALIDQASLEWREPLADTAVPRAKLPPCWMVDEFEALQRVSAAAVRVS